MIDVRIHSTTRSIAAQLDVTNTLSSYRQHRQETCRSNDKKYSAYKKEKGFFQKEEPLKKEKIAEGGRREVGFRVTSFTGA